jgi:hypothetical protein
MRTVQTIAVIAGLLVSLGATLGTPSSPCREIWRFSSR